MLRWAAEEDLIAVNFASAVRRAPEAERTRKLTDAEIIAIWRACGNLGSREAAKNYGRLVKFLLITAQRRDEAATLRHGHILNRVWRQSENKSNRPHAIPLPPLAFDLVGQGEARELAFAGRSGKIGGFSKLKAGARQGVRGFGLGAARSAKDGRIPDAGSPHAQPYRRADSEPCGAGRRRRLSAGRARGAEGRGAGGMVDCAGTPHQVQAGRRMNRKSR